VSEGDTPIVNAEVNRQLASGESVNGCLLSMTMVARDLERKLAETKANEAAMSQIAVNCQCQSKDAELAILRGNLAERDEQLSFVKGLLNTSEGSRKILGAWLTEAQSKLAEARMLARDWREKWSVEAKITHPPEIKYPPPWESTEALARIDAGELRE
jgi:hypothetical protein